jgi:hypothetical protein
MVFSLSQNVRRSFFTRGTIVYGNAAQYVGLVVQPFFSSVLVNIITHCAAACSCVAQKYDGFSIGFMIRNSAHVLFTLALVDAIKSQLAHLPGSGSPLDLQHTWEV